MLSVHRALCIYLSWTADREDLSNYSYINDIPLWVLVGCAALVGLVLTGEGEGARLASRQAFAYNSNNTIMKTYA